MAKDKVKADTPDPTKYFPNKGGIPGTMIPRAGADGQSLGFDHNQPQKVIIDPGEAGGGFELDFSAIAKNKNVFNAAASKPAVVDDVTSFYFEVSQQLASPEMPQAQPRLTKEEIVTESIRPLEKLAAVPSPMDYQELHADSKRVTSTASQKIKKSKKSATAELLQPLPAVPRATAAPTNVAAIDVERLLAEQLQKKVDELKRQYFNPEFKLASASSREVQPVMSSELVVDPMRQQMMQQATLIDALIDRVNILSSRPVAGETPAISLSETVTEEVLLETQPAVSPQSVFASLQIPFLCGEKATRPEYETYFEMSKMGTMAARYHAVVRGQSCLALVYDTRFVDGFQYLPPNLREEQITVSIPKLKETYNCSSLGLHWSLGCLDVVILILHDKGEDS